MKRQSWFLCLVMMILLFISSCKENARTQEEPPVPIVPGSNQSVAQEVQIPVRVVGAENNPREDQIEDISTWEVGNPAQSMNSSYDEMTIDPKFSEVLYISCYNLGFFKSVDGGESWYKVPLAGNVCSRLAINPTNRNILYIGAFSDNLGKYTIFKSMDAGQNWIAVDPDNFSGLPAAFIKPIPRDIVVNPLHPEIIYAGFGSPQGYNEKSGALFRSSDGGESWDKIFDGSIIHLAIDSKSGAIYCSRKIDESTGKKSGLFVSRDGGQSWRLLIDSRNLIDWIIIDGDNLYVGRSGHGGQRSSDGGASWRHFGKAGLATRNPHGYPIDLCQINHLAKDNSILYAEFSSDIPSMRGDLYFSSDDGQSWQRIYVGRQFNEIQVIDSKAPGGVKTKRTYIGEGLSVKILGSDPRIGVLYLLCSGNGIYALKDKGENCEKIFDAYDQ